MKIGIIAAINPQGIYAVEIESPSSPRKNGIPWSISDDFKNFKNVTVGNGDNKNCIIMGYTTKTTVPFLEERVNIVVTSKDEDKFVDGTIFAKSISEAIEKAKTKNSDLEEVWLIGGKGIWEEGLKIADKICLTVIDKKIPEDEQVFKTESLIPKNLEKDFSVISIKEKTTKSGLEYRFINFKRKNE